MVSEDKESQSSSQTTQLNTPCEQVASSITLTPVSISGPLPSLMSTAPSQDVTPVPASTPIPLSTQATLSTAPQNIAVQAPIPNVTASPLPQVQVIQQPLHNHTYLQQLYAPQQQMLLPSNLTIQSAGMAPTLQSLSAAQGLSLQLQGKATLDPKAPTPTIIPASPMQPGVNLSSPSLASAGGQVLAGGAKTCVQGQMLTAATKSTAVFQGQSGFVPSTTSQTVVIGQLLSSQPSILPSHARPQADAQKGKPYLVSQPAALQPKSPILPASSTAPTAQVLSNTQLKQLTSSPQLITSQAPAAMIASQAQILGSLQALGASLPQGITWAAPGALQSPALLTQNPIFIRSQQSDMFIQTPQPTATLHAVPVAAPPGPAPTPSPQVQKQKQVRPASSVATQTAVSTSTTTHSHISPTRVQGKQRSRTQNNHVTPGPGAGGHSTVLQTATTQTQTQLPQHQKADAANQTKPTPEMKSTATQSKATGTESKVTAHKCEAVAVVSSLSQKTTAATNTTSTATETLQNDNEESKPVEEPSVPNVAEKDSTDKEKPPATVEEPTVAPPEVGVKEKQPQKAIVKPHVLTHVIEGFVIQEGPEPFPVHRVFLKKVNNSTENASSQPVQSEKQPETEPSPPIRKVKKVPKVRGPVELAKCEFCGKLGPKSKFKRSKRFCSTSCAKRYNVGCSKRLAHAPPPSTEEVTVENKVLKKKKLGFKARKGWRKAKSGRLSYNVAEWQAQEVSSLNEHVGREAAIESEESVKIEGEVEGETTDTPSGPESSMSPTTPSSHREEMEVDIPDAPEPQPVFTVKSPLKWTVQDVVDFIQGLPGCADYADEFRSQEIDGQALLLLKEDHLMTAMSMKLGPALKICARITSLREEANRQ